MLKGEIGFNFNEGFGAVFSRRAQIKRDQTWQSLIFGTGVFLKIIQPMNDSIGSDKLVLLPTLPGSFAPNFPVKTAPFSSLWTSSRVFFTRYDYVSLHPNANHLKNLNGRHRNSILDWIKKIWLGMSRHATVHKNRLVSFHNLPV